MTLGDGVSVLTDDANESKKAYLGDINVGLLNNLVKGGKTQVCFNKLNYLSGSPIKYALEYSFDEEVVKRTENYNYSNNLYYFEISVPLEFTLFKCKVIAYNDIGQSSSEFEVNSEFDLGPIKNFGIIGDIKPNGNVKFIWNVYDDKEVSYTIEFSRDGYTWKKYKDVLKSELSGIDFTNSINIRYDYKLNDYYGLQYFRICSNKDKYYGYSNVVMIDTNNCLSTISDLRINGKTTMASYDVNENDVFRMTWKMRSLDGKAVEDRVMWSDNGENWYVIRSYDSYANKSTNVMNDYQITISSMHYVVYIRIDSICGSYRGESQIIKLNVKKSYVFYDEIASYLNRQAKLSVSDFGLFN